MAIHNQRNGTQGNKQLKQNHIIKKLGKFLHKTHLRKWSENGVRFRGNKKRKKLILNGNTLLCEKLKWYYNLSDHSK